MRLRHTSLTLVVLAAAAALLYSATKHDQSLSGIGALWEWLAEGQREISRLPMAMTRLPDDEEVAVGGRLAATEQLGSSQFQLLQRLRAAGRAHCDRERPGPP